MDDNYLHIDEGKNLYADEKECPICLSSINEKENYCITECKHEFCLDCLIIHLGKNENCPICRNKIIKHIENNNDDITDEERRILIFNNSSIIARFGGVSGPVCYFIQHIYIPCAVGTFTFFVISTSTFVYYIFKIISNF